MAKKDGDDVRPIIKKVKKVSGGGHHGGAWKVAYADFTTAMMAFFMLLWLLNVAPPETLAGLADYFSPTTAAVSGRTGADAAFQQLQEKLRMAIQKSPELASVSDQLIMEVTEDGMKIQLIDKDRRAMFKSGTDELYDFAKKMLSEIGKSIQTLPNRVTILGHTDGSVYFGPDGETNWELSAGRANAARRELDVSGVSNDRVSEVIDKPLSAKD